MDCKFCPIFKNNTCPEGFEIENGKCVEGSVMRLQRAIWVYLGAPIKSVKDNAASAINQSIKDLMLAGGGQYYPHLNKVSFELTGWDKISYGDTDEEQKALNLMKVAEKTFEGTWLPIKEELDF